MARINLEQYISTEALVSQNSTDSHSLFVDEVAGIKTFRLFLEEFNPEHIKIHPIINQLLSGTAKDSLEVRINSNGGSITEGLRLTNTFKSVFGENRKTFLDTTAKSMGAMLFCDSPVRVIYENSEIMFHYYSDVVIGKGDDITSKSEHTRDYIDKVIEDILLKQNLLTEEEIQRMADGKTYWFNAKQMCERGIATHIMIDGKEIPSKEYLAV